MVDFVKIVLISKPLVKYIAENHKWEAYHEGNKAMYKSGVFTAECYDSGRVLIKGSLHKFSQGNNWGNFTRLDLWDTIREVEGLLCAEAEKMKLENIEIGVNIETDFDPSEFVKNDVILYKDEAFRQYKTKEFITGTGIEVCKDEYRVKVYDKGKKEGREGYILRFEVHYSKMRPLKTIGITSLADLLNESNLKELGGLLHEAWGEVLIVEHLSDSTLTKAEKKQYENATNPRHWQTITRKQRADLKRKYGAIVKKYVKESRKKKIGEAIRMQWEYLLKDSKIGNVFPDPQKERFPHLCKRGNRYQYHVESSSFDEAESLKNFRAPQPPPKKYGHGYRGHLVLKELQRKKETELRRREVKIQNQKAELRHKELKMKKSKIKSVGKIYQALKQSSMECQTVTDSTEITKQS